jgi:hypothetical protein
MNGSPLHMVSAIDRTDGKGERTDGSDIQGLRMKNACEDLEHVLVVPSGYFSSSAQAVP